MDCGVKYCGGCNPKYDREAVLRQIREHFQNRAQFSDAKEDVVYDLLLVIGGCSSCCASFGQYQTRFGIVRLWDRNRIADIIGQIESIAMDQEKC